MGVGHAAVSVHEGGTEQVVVSGRRQGGEVRRRRRCFLRLLVSFGTVKVGLGESGIIAGSSDHFAAPLISV